MSYYHTYSARRDVNAELREAIFKLDRELAKHLLADGADINHAVNGDRDTMLHQALTLIQVYYILGYGADVNARNVHGKTPLHVAAEGGKCAEVVESLIAHGGDVDILDKCGNVPLNYAVRRREKDYAVIKELVMKGSMVMQQRTAFDWDSTGRTPLKDAVLMDDTKCVRTLIMYHLLQSHSRVPHTVALAEYCRHRRYNRMTDFYNKCCSELRNMEKEVVHKQTRTTLLNVIRGRFSLNDALGKGEEAVDTFANRCLWLMRTLKYSVYNDVILSKLGQLLDQRCLMKQMREVEFYTCVDLVKNVSPNVDKKIIEDSNYNNVVANADQEKVAGCLDQHSSAASDPKKTEMEPNQKDVLYPDSPLSKGHAGRNVSFSTDLHKVKLDPDKVISNVMSPKAEMDTDIIVGLKLNLNNAYDLRAELHEKVDPPGVIFNEKLHLNNAYDLMEDVDKVDLSQKVEGTENMEEKPYKKVVLHGDLVATIAAYLNKSDLLNWIVAYYVPDDIPQGNEEEEGSIDWWRKLILKRVCQSGSSHAHKLAKFSE